VFRLVPTRAHAHARELDSVKYSGGFYVNGHVIMTLRFDVVGVHLVQIAGLRGEFAYLGIHYALAD
jgi:hypothetical protein